MSEYPAQKEKEERDRWKLTILAKQLGLNITDLTDEEIKVLMTALRKSDKLRQGKRRR